MSAFTIRLSGPAVLASIVAASFLPVTNSTQAATSLTGIQMNGASCVRAYTNGATLRNDSGLRNQENGSITAVCPIIKPSSDSDPFGATLSQVEVFYLGSTPTCWISHRTTNGSVYWSSQLTAATSESTGTPVLALDELAPPSQPVIGTALYCTLPFNSGVRGMTALSTVAEIDTGQPAL
jgi:hypothetical protein